MPTLLSAINASASGLDAQRARMEVAISNMANADSTTSADGTPYRRREVVLSSQPFESSLDPAANAVGGVKVEAVREDQSGFDLRYEPDNPSANGDGYVAYPNVQVAEEMVDMISAARAYQANLTAIGLIRDTIQRALELAK
jgi:flagellar basal-body rod protein FlgC